MRPRQTVARRRPELRSAQLQLGRKHRPDYWLLIWCAALLAIGLIVVYAISPALAAAHHVSGNYYVGKQLLAIGLSLVALVVTSQVPLKWWRQAYKPILIVAGIATLLALILPVDPAYPAHRWVRLGGLSFQSVELVKFAVLIWLAGFLARRIQDGSISSTQQTLKPLFIALAVIAAVVVVIQSDLGSAGVMVAIVAIMAFVAGLPMGRIMAISGVVLIGLVLAVSATPYRRDRLQAFLHPEAHCQSSGYQACQAMIAVGSGGVIGLGLGSSVQAYGYLPEAANDSIFAIYAEKFGFIGSVILLAVFVAFFTRLKNIAERLPDDFSRLLVVGVLAWLSTQTLINVGAMIGLLPLKGITLPFISYGGTSVVFAAAAVGLAFQASQYASLSAPRTPANDLPSGRDFRNTTVRRASY
ncbi:stage V sporulation protein E [Candidatus Saccharibacteria bacterium CG_4_10_14_0_2_um_filter_52_9]|nr:MAG: stage V sporulation protein E [Candidatus Saccharibacteria bacterium CG_4_10_14_0_2_um_filter_52_9]